MRIFLLLLAIVMMSSSCVYFNTFYNAQKFFRQAEKERRQHEEQNAGWELEEGEEAQQRPRPRKADQLYDQAARKASRVLEKYKESDLIDDAMFLMGRSFYWRSEYLGAVEAFRDLETNFPDSEYYNQARYWRALCLEKQRIYDQAQQLYRALFDEAEEDMAAQAGWRLGEMAFARGDYVAAAQEYRMALDAFADADIRAGLWLRFGTALLALEDSTRYVEAGEAFRQVLKEQPDKDQEYRARLNGARVLYLQGDASGALDAYSALLKNSSFRAYEGRTRLLIGQYYQERHGVERAVAEYEQVRDDFPQSPSSALALYRTGLLYLQEKGDTELAREYFEETGRERAGSQGARLAQEMMRHLSRLQTLQRRVQRADSLAADSLGGIAGPVLHTEQWQPPEEGEVVVARSFAVLDDLFSVAEIYRDFVGQADSSIAYYGEVIRRFPTTEQLPRALYSIAWIHLEMKEDEATARPYLDQLIEDFPASAHANEARRLLERELRTTDEERAAVEFAQIETLRLEDRTALERYVPLLDSLALKYPGTQVGGQAVYLTAASYENVRGDTLEAERRFALLEEKFRETRYGELAVARREARAAGLVAKLERSLKAVGGQLKPGEYIEVLATEPDTLDSVALGRKYMGFALRAHRRGELQTARSFYERSLEEQLNNAEGLYLLGNISWEDGFFKEAIELYRQTLSFTPTHLKTHYRLFGAFVAEAEEDSANYYLKQLLKRDARNPQMRFIAEQHPDLNSPDGEELELSELEELGISVPEDELRWKTRDLRLGELPLVREVAQPDRPFGTGGDSLEVLVDVLIDKEGKAELVEVFRGDEPFAQAAVTAAYNYVFYPAMRRDGLEIKVWVELGIPFLPVGAAVDTTAPLQFEVADEGL